MKEYKLELFDGECEICTEYRSFECHALATDYAAMQLCKPVVGGGSITSVKLYSGDDWENCQRIY